MLSWLADRWQRRATRLRLARGRRGRILAVKWGYNPNSSSLGVDVTFLLFGMVAVALLTPLIAMVLRARGLLGVASQQSPPATGDANDDNAAAPHPESGAPTPGS